MGDRTNPNDHMADYDKRAARSLLEELANLDMTTATDADAWRLLGRAEFVLKHLLDD